MIASQPVPSAGTQLLHTFHATNFCSDFGTEQASISCFVGQTSHSGKPLIDGAGRQAKRFQIQTKSQNYSPIQCECRFGTIPSDELLHREFIVSPRTRRTQAVQHGWLLLLDRCDLVLLPTLHSVRLDRASIRSHSAGVQNCRDRLVMRLTSTIEPKAERITSVTEWFGD